MTLEQLKTKRFFIEADDIGQSDVPDEHGYYFLAEDVLPLIERIEEVLKEMRAHEEMYGSDGYPPVDDWIEQLEGK